jgi:threonyl-tRNA synthetase
LNGDDAVLIEPVLPQTLDGLDVLRHSTAHLLAAAVLDLFRERNSASAPLCLMIRAMVSLRRDCHANFDGSRFARHRKKMRDIAKRNLAYRREVIAKAEALRVFAERDEPLKQQLVKERAAIKSAFIT